jgi:hypothetical protein
MPLCDPYVIGMTLKIVTELQQQIWWFNESVAPQAWNVDRGTVKQAIEREATIS